MNPKTRTVIIHINDNFHRRLLCGDIAKMVNISPSRLRHMFKAETGRSLARHVKSIRIEKAKELLETTFFSVKEVMAKVGMSDESHFVRDFKKECGMTPSQYRVVSSIARRAQLNGHGANQQARASVN